MGRQIAIAQSETDEAELNQLLRAQYDLVSVPLAQSSERFRPVPLGEGTAHEQVFFLKDDASEILRHTLEAEDRPGTFLVRRSKVGGRIIEWDRTRRGEGNRIHAGRYYLDSEGTTGGRGAQTMKRIMATIQQHIRKTYPMRSKERHPIYVGRDMSAQIKQGKTKLVYEGKNAIPIELIENE